MKASHSSAVSFSREFSVSVALPPGAVRVGLAFRIMRRNCLHSCCSLALPWTGCMTQRFGASILMSRTSNRCGWRLPRSQGGWPVAASCIGPNRHEFISKKQAVKLRSTKTDAFAMSTGGQPQVGCLAVPVASSRGVYGCGGGHCQQAT